MRTILFPALFGAVVMAATGCSGPAAGNGTATSPAGSRQTASLSGTASTTTTRTAGPAASGNVNIMAYSINTDGPGLRAVVTGAIGDYGPAVTVFPDGKTDPSHMHDLLLKLTRGSFRLSIAGLGRKFVQAASHEPIYPRTCSDHMSVSAPVPVVPGSGAGAYHGISGSFRATMTADEVEHSPCQPATAFRWQVIVIAGHGTVSPG